MPKTTDRTPAIHLHDFCNTARQTEVLNAYLANGESATAAGRALGISRETVKSAISDLRKRAVKSLPVGALPTGHRLKGVSTLTGEDGQIDQQWAKTELAPTEPAKFEAVPEGFFVKGISSYIDRTGKVAGQWVSVKPDAEDAALAALEAGLRESMRSYIVPVAPATPPDWFDSSTCAVIPIGDTHIGMLAHDAETGENSDLKIQERDLCAAMDHLVAGMPRSAVCTIIPLGDNLHADDELQRTPAHHHKLSVDGRPDKVARVAINIYRRLIDRALQRFQQVNVEVVGGNHDVVTSLWLRIALGFVYENEPRVRVNPSPMALRCWSFGANMFGTCHGDGIKPEKMMSVMAARYREMWGQAVFVFGYQGHRHKRMVIESDGGVVEVFRTMTGKDEFAVKYGYESGNDLVGITYHELYGEIERKTISKALARSAFGLVGT